MYARFQELMTQGHSLSNKFYFGQWNQDEFERWLDDCHNLLSSCEPEPQLPWFPNVQHIEEIVMLLWETRHKIFRREVYYMGL
jgi:hypothetical protein